MSPRPTSVAASIQWLQWSQSLPMLPMSEPTMARGDILPPLGRIEARDAHKNNTRRRNNQSESGRGNAGVEKDTNNTTISRNGGGIVEKIQQLSWTVAATVDGMKTQQPTGHTDNDNNERMQRAGEEMGSRNNTTINQSGWYWYFLLCCLCGFVYKVIVLISNKWPVTAYYMFLKVL